MHKKRSKHISLERKQTKFGYIFVAPFLVGLVFFIIIPLIQAMIFSFNELKLVADGYTLDNVGLSNFEFIFLKDNAFRDKLVTSLGNMALNVPICTLFAFFMASILNTKFRGRTMARVILFLPVITASGVIVDLLAGYTLQTLQRATDSATSSGLSDAIVSLMNEMSINQSLIGFIAATIDRIAEITNMSAIPIVIFLSGLQSISPSIFEASYMEGATKWDVFWKISLPMISPLILVCVVYAVIDSFTNIANPLIKYIHQTNFESIKFGRGSAVAISYMLIMGAILGLVYWLISKIVIYQEER